MHYHSSFWISFPLIGLSFMYHNSFNKNCAEVYTLAHVRIHADPPVPVCTILWLVPQKVWCQPHIRQCLLLLVSQIASLGSLHRLGGLGVIIMSNLNRVRLSCCWVGVGLGCDNCYIAVNRIKCQGEMGSETI